MMVETIIIIINISTSSFSYQTAWRNLACGNIRLGAMAAYSFIATQNLAITLGSGAVLAVTVMRMSLMAKRGEGRAGGNFNVA